ncbi:MAG: hypothetical protein PHG85_03115 [Candidatus Altiarchaeota archaeon]|nr:hypothetical protein [Candidatus Altiarchaeota archaeon]
MDIKKVITAERIITGLRVFLILYFIVIILSLSLNVIDGPQPIEVKFLGENLALLDHLMNVIMLVLAVFALYGLIRKSKWTYTLIMLFLILGAIGEFTGLALIYINFDKMDEVMAMIATERGHTPQPISKEFIVFGLFIAAIIKTIGYLIFMGIDYWLMKKVNKGVKEVEDFKNKHPIEWETIKK